MFSKVRKVEIEIFSKCNRHCAWCPNKILNRDNYIELEEKLFLDILHNLKENKFEDKSSFPVKLMSFSRFCEPFYNTKLLKKRVEQTKNILPLITININSNGDYLDTNSLDDLLADEVSFMDYDCKGLDWCVNKLKEIGATNINICNGIIRAKYNNIRIRYIANWPLTRKLENRGGLLNEDVYYNGTKLKWTNEKTIRTIPCYEPQDFIAIDYTGAVTPCCHIRSDDPKHEIFVLGNINNNTLSEIYSSKKAEHFKKTMSQNNNHFEPCKHCQKIPFYDTNRRSKG